jgi:hypothetical protein
MSSLTPFGACVDYLRISYAELAEILSDVSGEYYNAQRAKKVCQGKEPVPAFAWSTLREAHRILEYRSDQFLRLHKQSRRDRFILTQDDLWPPQLRRVLVRTMLKIEGGEPVEMIQKPGPTWGWD